MIAGARRSERQMAIAYDNLGVWYQLQWSSNRDNYFLMGGESSIWEVYSKLRQDAYFRCLAPTTP